MSNSTRNKRDSLESFIREQTLGPGVNGYRYVDTEDESITKRDLEKDSPLNYESEILDTVPAAVYSTGILYPEDKSNTINNSALEDKDATEPSDDGEDEDAQDTLIDENQSVEVNQMYPRTMGLTLCLTDEFLTNGSIDFNVSFRYYSKLIQDKEGLFNQRYALRCEVTPKEMNTFIDNYKLSDFYLRKINNNHFVFLSKLKPEEIKQVRERIKFIQKECALDLLKSIKSLIDIPKITEINCHLSSLKSSIYYELKNVVFKEDVKRQLYIVTQKIELIENVIVHLKDLLDIGSGSYGLWSSKLIERNVSISNIIFPESQKKQSFLYNRENDAVVIAVKSKDKHIGTNLRNIFKYDLNDKTNDFASISLNVQLSRDSRNQSNKIFLKIQAINTSVGYDESQEGNNNRYYSNFNESVNCKSFFGVKISIDRPDIVPYSEYNYEKKESINEYSEDTTTKFIYSQFKDFAIGHGCSVKWNNSEEGTLVETEYIPYCDTPEIDTVPRDKSSHSTQISDHNFISPLFLENSRAQEFKWLSIFSDAKNTEVISGILEFIESYGNWIEIKRNKKEYKSIYKDIATQELDKCEGDYLRMRSNVLDFLEGESNSDNLDSFRLMNAAMFMQLWHSTRKKEEMSSIFDSEVFDVFNRDFYSNSADDKIFSERDSASWRAFQLAFILLNLDGIFHRKEDHKWEQRNDWVDLVWFPTGGGKTEAYLGLIALTVINRRKLHNEMGGGTAAIMRYTLRLLTMQQFQRATLLIMALELMRRWNSFNLGNEPITVGLWVGKDSIPNNNADLIFEYKSKLNLNINNRIPLSNCPWCKSDIKGEEREDKEPNTLVYNRDKVHLKCTNLKCSFSFGLGRPSRKREFQGPIPVSLSDETIYQHPPTLLFGTVDKFAQLAHKVNGGLKNTKADSRRIFGRGNWEQGKPKNGYLTPDLIIQDELHLLLGPLGSGVALFESAIDQLCTREDGTRAKVISSTATTRNTQLQIAALFDRQVNLFPKPGVECDDSFFAFYKRSFKDKFNTDLTYHSKRKYIGLLPTGKTQIWMQMRLAAIIMTHRAIFELNELDENNPLDHESYQGLTRIMDCFHTTISYFNSLKEVGKTQSQVQSYILKEYRKVFNRSIRPQKLLQSMYTYGPLIESELTGRLSGEEVKNELKIVESIWSSEKRFATLNSNNETISGSVPPDFVVATNMISVGIDVSRFNTILMNSMPRNTAEYIQASSRVARSDYGLVLTIHHPFRARDVSYYEKFIEFHNKMYSYVEPISITPFTKKSVERYMGLYLSTIMRHMHNYENRHSPADITKLTTVEIEHLVNQLMSYFIERKKRLEAYGESYNVLIKNDNLTYIKTWIEVALKDWITQSNKTTVDNKDLVFNNARFKSNQEQLYVNIDEYAGNIHSNKWRIPMSLRVIDPAAAIKIHSK